MKKKKKKGLRNQISIPDGFFNLTEDELNELDEKCRQKYFISMSFEVENMVDSAAREWVKKYANEKD